MKVKVKNIKFSCIFLLLIFLTCLDGLTSIHAVQFVLKHVDEFLILVFLFYIIQHGSFLIKEKKSFLFTWMVFLALGAISSVLCRYQDLYAVLVDCILIINKFMVGYLAAYTYIILHKQKISDRVYKTAKAITILLFVLAVHDFILPPLFPKADFRYFTYSLQLMFPHATYLAATGSTLLIYFGYKHKKKSDYKYMYMASFLALATLRGKAVGFIMVYWLFYLCIYVFRARHYFFTIISGGIAAALIGTNQIEDYFFTKSYSPRLLLLRDSITLAIQHFPFGTGYGTFGSAMASERYSILYTQLGYENYWGMGSKDGMFLTDDFWPIVIAQFGVLGLVAFIFIVYYLVKRSLVILKVNKDAGFAMLLIMINTLINSLAETAFFNPTALLFFVLFGICEAEALLEKKTERI